MNKLLGYTELNMPWGKVPVKVASYAMENICADFGIEIYDLETLFTVKEVTVDDEVKETKLPKQPGPFFRSLILHSANYVRQQNGERLLTESEVREWMEEIGFNNEELGRLLLMFSYCASTGKPLPMADLEEKKSQ